MSAPNPPICPVTARDTDLPPLLRQYGQAVRGAFYDLDGRTVATDMNLLASWAADATTCPGPRQARADLDLCLEGGEHWRASCTADDDCAPPPHPAAGTR